MTEEEARLFLQVEDDDSIEDAFELAVFEIRQFLVTRPVLLKTFQDKRRRLAKLVMAFSVLGGTETAAVVKLPLLPAPSDNVQEHLAAYHRTKNELKRLLLSATDFAALSAIIDALIELERVLAKPFERYTDWTDGAPIIGKEPDAMAFRELLHEQALAGRTDLAQLAAAKNELPAALLLELKRLSLLKNYLYE